MRRRALKDTSGRLLIKDTGGGLLRTQMETLYGYTRVHDERNIVGQILRVAEVHKVKKRLA